MTQPEGSRPPGACAVPIGRFRSARAVPLLVAGGLSFLLIAGSVGCAGYERKPIDREAHASAWRDRSPDAEPLRDFAERLGQSDRPGTPEAFNPSDGLSLAEAEIVALFFHPTLRRLRIEANVPFVTAENAGRWPDPEIEAGGETILRSVDEPFIVEAGLRFTIPLGGRLGAEKDQLLAEYDAARWRVRIAESAVIDRLRSAWIAWSFIDERLAQITEYQAHIARLEAIVAQLAEAGEARSADRRLFEIESVQLDDEARQLQAMARQYQLQLRQQMGLTPDAPLDLQPSKSIGSLPEDLAGQRDRLMANHPEIAGALAAHEVAEATTNLEVQRQYPDLGIGIGFAYEEGLPRVTYGLGLPIPAFDGNGTAIARARAEREGTRAAYAEVVELLVHALAQTEAQRAALIERVGFVESTLVPLLQSQLEDAQRLAELGEFDAFLLLDALRNQHETRLRLLDLREQIALREADLHALIGRSYIPPMPDEQGPAGDDAINETNTSTDEEDGQ